MDFKREFYKVSLEVLTEADLILTDAQDKFIPGLISDLEDGLSKFFIGVEDALGKGQEHVLDLKEKVERKLN